MSEIVSEELIFSRPPPRASACSSPRVTTATRPPTLGKPEADCPASSPWVTAVGGTSLGVAPNGRVAFETGWEHRHQRARRRHLRPARARRVLLRLGRWHERAVRASPRTKWVWFPRRSRTRTDRCPRRVVPDMSIVGDPNTGMLVGQTQKFPGKEGVHYDEYRIGGTSLSSPLLAGHRGARRRPARHRARFHQPVAVLAGARRERHPRHRAREEHRRRRASTT